MDTNLSYQPTPQKGETIQVTVVGTLNEGKMFSGKVVKVFPAGKEVPEHLMRRYYQPKKGSPYDLNPGALTRASRYDRVVLQVGFRHYLIYPHQRYYEYEVINAQKIRSKDPRSREQEQS